MPHIIISNLTKHLGNKTLFNNINLRLKTGIYGLVGRNGTGKSTFLRALVDHKLSSESIKVSGKCQFFSQLLAIPKVTVAEYLGVDKQLKAFARIEAGSTKVSDFELLQEQWHLRHEINQLLKDLGLPQNPFMRCVDLSGGQLTRLKLHVLLTDEQSILLLDEPSNHLDAMAKQWLITRVKAFRGLVLIASHDQPLLDCADHILHFNNHTITPYAMNYERFQGVFAQQQAALGIKIETQKAEHKKVQKVVQQSLERAAQRAAKGKKIRAKGSQPKMLLDAKKNAADKTKSRLTAMQDNRLKNIKETLSNLEKQQSVTKAQHIYLNSSELNKDYTLLTVKDWQCKYVNGPCVSFTVKQMSRIWLKGSNGTGKSTLLNTLRASRSDSPNVMYKNCEITYLDQHYSWLDNFSSSLDALMTISDSLTVQQARTLLAGIGFKGDTVFTNTSYLSGGERMKVAMLCTSYAKNNALLLLDEPDNHLDLDSKNQLANALSQYKGAFILVSHDSDFVNAVDINTIVDINLIEPIVVTK